MSVDSFGYLIEKSTRLGTIYFWRTSASKIGSVGRGLEQGDLDSKAFHLLR